jgi:hypothetical protein
MDILFVIVMWVVIEYTLKKHNVSNGKEGLNVIGGLIASFFLLALVRLPIYLLLYGCRFPFHPSDTAVTLSGIFAIVFWGAMLWWRIPGRVVRAIFPPKPLK